MEEAESPSACSFQTVRLLPEIRIDTSRLDGLLSGFQRRISALETSFARVAESAAEAAHKAVLTTSPRNTAPPSPARPTPSSPGSPRSPSAASYKVSAITVRPPVATKTLDSALRQDPYPEREEIPLAESHSREETGETSVAVAAVSRKPSGATEEPRDTRQESQEVNGDQPRQTLEPLGTESDPSVAANEVKAEATAQPDSSAIQHTSVSGENSLVQDSKVDSAVIESVAQASAASAKEAIQPQVDALWDAVKWMEDRMEAIDAERRGELEEASRTAAQNTAKVEVAKMDRERIKLALEDRPVRSEFEALDELQEGRLRTTGVELRRVIASLSNRLQEELHKKIDVLYEDTSNWKKRLDTTTERVDQRVRHLEQELDDEIRDELGDTDFSDEEGEMSGDTLEKQRGLSLARMSPRSTPRSGRRRRSVLMQKVRNKRESGMQRKFDDALLNSKQGDMELSAGVASLRAELAQLLLRMEEGEMEKDQFVREVDDRVCEAGQEVEVSLARIKGEVLEELELTQVEMEKLSMKQEKAVTPESLNEALRASDAVRDVATKAFTLEESVSALAATLQAAEKKIIQLDETSSQNISEAERRMSARVQSVTNKQTAVYEQLDAQVRKLKNNKADEDSLRETRDELKLRLTTLEDVTTAAKQEVVDLLKAEVDAVLYRVLEVENVAEAVRSDLSPEIAALGDGVESVHISLKRALEDHQRVLDNQDAKVSAFSVEVREACSSVTSNVRDMLVCLVASSRRRELERQDNPEEEASLAEVATVVREQQHRREESARRIERANLGLTVLVKKLERNLSVFSSKDLVWEAMGLKLKAHVEALADASCRVETTSDEQDRFVLTTELQRYVAGHSQRVANLMCKKADFEIIQKLTASTNIEKGGRDWDRRVQTMRTSFLEHFMADARRYVDKKYPTHGPFSTRNRDRFFVKVEQGLKVAMSKYRSVDVGNTLFGKVKLDPCCIACDRPFGAAAQATPGDVRAAPLEPLPPTQTVKDAMAGRPRTPSTPPDGPRAPDPFIDPAAAGGFGGGRHQKNASKFVYRGGFKIPKELTPMPSVESFGALPGGLHASCSINLDSNGGSEWDADPSGENCTGDGGKGGRKKLRDRGSKRQGTGGETGLMLEGIISSSKMRMGSGSERGGVVRLPRPKTAGATVGRGGSVYSAEERGALEALSGSSTAERRCIGNE